MLPFISRHDPTAAQRATVSSLGELTAVEPVVFEPGRVTAQVTEAILAHVPLAELPEPTAPAFAAAVARLRIVAGVFPAWAALELLRSGFTVIEFQNEPSARARGVFVCRGAFVHTLHESRFLACPVPATEQADEAAAGHAGR